MPKGRKGREEKKKVNNRFGRRGRESSEDRNSVNTIKRALRSTTTHTCKSCNKQFDSPEAVNRHSRACRSAKNRSLKEIDESSSSSPSSSESEGSSSSSSFEIVPVGVKRPRGRPPKNKNNESISKTNVKDNNKEPSESSVKKSSLSNSKKSKKTSRTSRSSSEESTEIIIKPSKSEISKPPTKTTTTTTKSKKKVEKGEDKNITTTTTGKGNENPLTCEKCKLTYRTESGFYNHISTCLPYFGTSSDDEKNVESEEEEVTKEDTKPPQRRPGYEENVIFSDEEDVEPNEKKVLQPPMKESKHNVFKHSEKQSTPKNVFTYNVWQPAIDNILKSDVTENPNNNSMTSNNSSTKVVSKKPSKRDCPTSIPTNGPPPAKQPNQFVASVERFFSQSSSTIKNESGNSSSTSNNTTSSSKSTTTKIKKKMTSSSSQISSDKANHFVPERSSKITNSVGSQSESESHPHYFPQKKIQQQSSSSSSSKSKDATISHIHTSIGGATGLPDYSHQMFGDSRYRPNGQHHHHQPPPPIVQDTKVAPGIFSPHHHQPMASQLNANSSLLNSTSSSIPNPSGLILGESSLHSRSSSQFSPNVNSNQLLLPHPPLSSPLSYPLSPSGYRSDSSFSPSYSGLLNATPIPQTSLPPPILSPSSSQSLQSPVKSVQGNYEPETITMQDASGQIMRIQVPSMSQQLHIQPAHPPQPLASLPLTSPLLSHHPTQEIHQQQVSAQLLMAQQQHLNFSYLQPPQQQQHHQLHYSQQHDLDIQNMIFQQHQQQQQQFFAAHMKQQQFLEAQLKEQHLQHELQQHSLHQYLIKQGLAQHQQQLSSTNVMINTPTQDTTQWYSIPNQSGISSHLSGGPLHHHQQQQQQTFIHNNASTTTSSYVLLQNGLNFALPPTLPSPRQQQHDLLAAVQQQQQHQLHNNPLLHHSQGLYGGAQVSPSYRLSLKTPQFPTSHLPPETLYTLPHKSTSSSSSCTLKTAAAATTTSKSLAKEKITTSKSSTSQAQACPCTLCIQKASSRGTGTPTIGKSKSPSSVAESSVKHITKNKVQQQFSAPVWNANPPVTSTNEKSHSSSTGKSSSKKHHHHHRNRIGPTTSFQKILPAIPPTSSSSSSTSSNSMMMGLPNAFNPLGATNSEHYNNTGQVNQSVMSTTANVAVVRPLENPLQKLSAQISQLGTEKIVGIPLVSYPDSGGGGLDKPYNTDSQSAVEKDYHHHTNKNNNKISSDSSYGQRNSSPNHSHGPPSKHTKRKSSQSNDKKFSSDPPVKRRRSSKVKSVGTQQDSKKKITTNQGTSIKVTLKRKEGLDSYSIRDIKDASPSDEGTYMRSLKIKAKITSGELAGSSTDVVVVPLIHTVPVPLDSESNRTIPECDEEEEVSIPDVKTTPAITTESKDEEKEDNTVGTENKAVELQVPPPLKKTHRVVILYEVKTGQSVLFRSSCVRAVWSHIFENVQGQRSKLYQSLPPLAYPQQLLSLPGRRPDVTACPTFHTSETTHRAVKFLLQNLPGPGTTKTKAKSKKKQQLSLESVTEEGVVPASLEPECARGIGFAERKPFDMFGWLASKHRTLPTLERSLDGPKAELPIAMRYRTLREKSPCLLNVFYSTIHGRGLFTRRDIPEGEIIIEYAGEVIRSILCDFREKYYESKGYGCYMFKIDDEEVVDSTLRGNAARFINHSCDPNCKSKVVEIMGKKRILIFSLRKIVGGEELTYDYKFAKEDKDKKIPCTCGTKRCRKFLN